MTHGKLNAQEIQDAGEILRGYENWRRQKLLWEEDQDSYSVTAYLDDLAKQRALEAIQEIEKLYSDPELTWQEIDAGIRNILGVKS